MSKNQKRYFCTPIAQGGIIRAEDAEGKKKIIKGLAVRFNSPTVLFTDNEGNDYLEVIDPGAFEKCQMDDVILDRGHDMEGKLLARTKSGTLTLSLTEEGLAYECELPDTALGNETFALAVRGDLYGSSFAATVAEDSYNKDTRTRTIRSFDRLYDVSVVTFPAYKDTEVSAEMRSAFQAELNKPTDQEKFELAKAKLLMSI